MNNSKNPQRPTLSRWFSLLILSFLPLLTLLIFRSHSSGKDHHFRHLIATDNTCQDSSDYYPDIIKLTICQPHLSLTDLTPGHRLLPPSSRRHVPFIFIGDSHAHQLAFSSPLIPRTFFIQTPSVTSSLFGHSALTLQTSQNLAHLLNRLAPNGYYLVISIATDQFYSNTPYKQYEQRKQSIEDTRHILQMQTNIINLSRHLSSFGGPKKTILVSDFPKMCNEIEFASSGSLFSRNKCNITPQSFADRQKLETIFTQIAAINNKQFTLWDPYLVFAKYDPSPEKTLLQSMFSDSSHHLNSLSAPLLMMLHYDLVELLKIH